MRATLLFTGLVTLAGCEFQRLGSSTSTTGAGGTTSHSQGGSGGSNSSAGGSSGSGGTSTGSGGSSGDGAPQGAVSFFQSSACPEGWALHDAAAGRLVLPAVEGAAAGDAHGTPLGAGEDRAHSHDVAASFSVAGVSFVANAGAGNGLAAAGTIPVKTTTAPSSAQLPYVQLLMCKKKAAPAAPAMPRGAHLFFEGTECPAGWTRADATRGRFLVGLPDGAPADLPFGAAASAGPFTHAHDTSLTLQTEAHGVEAISGCCNAGFAKDGTYTSAQPTSAEEVGIPYLALIQCSKD